MPTPIRFIGKTFSKELDGNLSLAIIDPEVIRDYVAIACTIFMKDGETLLDSFTIVLSLEEFKGYIEE